MDIKEDFINLNFLDENIVNENEEILKNTFGINIDKLIKDIQEDINKSKLDYDSIIIKIHQNIICYIADYNIDIYKYFKRNSCESNNIISQYLLKNIKFNVKMYYINKCKDQENKYISQIDAIKKYISKGNDKDKSNRADKELYLGQEKDTQDVLDNKKIELQNRSRQITMNIKKFTEDEDCRNIINMFIDKSLLSKSRTKACYSLTSNIFIDMMWNMNKTIYNNTFSKLESKKKLTYNFEVAERRMKSFLNRDIGIEEKYFWERINNVVFVKTLFFSVIEKENDLRERLDLFNYLLPVIYLPNAFINKEFLVNLILIYRNEPSYYKHKAEFEESVKKVCLHLAFLVIPLYNKVFSVILQRFNKSNILDLNNYMEKLDVTEMIKYFEISNEKYDNKKEFFKAEFRYLSANTFKNINFNIFTLNRLVDGIGNFQKEFLDIMKTCPNYRTILKDFILNIIFNIDVNDESCQ